ncbi:MAG: hypothetical protein IKB51_07415 [Clostridia bacterium]|nr:hypothetical protein [Clostridia bacterium]
MFLSLQFFAEGAGNGDGGTGATGPTGDGAISANATDAVSQNKGVKDTPLKDVKYGVQPTETKEEDSKPAAEAETQTVDLNAEFEELIKGKYKDVYGAKLQDTVQRRLKGPMEKVDKYNALIPMLELLGKKYGVDASDPAALVKAIEADDSYFEDEALEKGVSVDALRTQKKLEKENRELQRQLDARNEKENTAKQYSTWIEQAEKAKATYPNLDLRAEIQNPEFAKLLMAGIDVGSAYLVIHKDDVIPAAMQYTAKQVQQKVTNNVIANGARVSENGLSPAGAAVVKSDVSKLTSDDIREIQRRVARGEKISFG